MSHHLGTAKHMYLRQICVAKFLLGDCIRKGLEINLQACYVFESGLSFMCDVLHSEAVLGAAVFRDA